MLYDIVSALLDSCLDFRLEVVLGKRAAYVRVILKAKEGVRVQIQETLEQLLVAIEEFLVYLYIESLFDMFQALHSISVCEKVLFSEHVIFLLLSVSGVHDG